MDAPEEVKPKRKRGRIPGSSNQTEEAKTRRLEKNRKSAQESRKRKK